MPNRIPTGWFTMLGWICALGFGAAIAQGQGESESRGAHFDGVPPEGVAVLRNGEVLRGKLGATRERLSIGVPGGEIVVRRGDLDVVAKSMEEAFEIKRRRASGGRTDDRLDLVDWCVHHKLLPEAQKMLLEAVALQPAHHRIPATERKVRQALALAESQRPPVGQAVVHLERIPSPALFPVVPAREGSGGNAGAGESGRSASETQATTIASAGAPATNAELERLARSLPEGAVEAFTNDVQPLLLMNCATAGCHAPGGSSKFTLLKPPVGKGVHRRLTQRNLHSVLGRVDFSEPEKSALLTMPTRPHGGLKTPVFADAKGLKTRQMAEWVEAITGRPREPAREAVATGFESVLGPLDTVSQARAGTAAQSKRTASGRSRRGRPMPEPFIDGNVRPASTEVETSPNAEKLMEAEPPKRTAGVDQPVNR